MSSSFDSKPFGDEKSEPSGSASYISGLSLQDQFAHHRFTMQAEQMSREQAIHFAVQLHQQLLIQKHTYNQLLKKEWNLD